MPEMPINKTMDFDDLNSEPARHIIHELNGLVREIRDMQLKISSWYGKFDLSGDTNSFEWINRGHNYKPIEGAADDRNFPWFLYWEIVWLVLNSNFDAHDRLLELGGSSSLFSYYMASKGLDVYTVDINEGLVRNANHVANVMGWKMQNHVMDMRNLHFAEKFDRITSICVYEHIPMYDRVAINSRIKDLLVQGGTFSVTFDYRNPSKLARIKSPEDVYEQFVKPSGLRVRGNQVFYDNGKNYLLHPFYFNKWSWSIKQSEITAILAGNFSVLNFFKTKDYNDYTFGALFLEKPMPGI